LGEKAQIGLLMKALAPILLLGTIVIASLVPLQARGEIYVYVDENGVSHYTNVPTGNHYKPMHFGRVNPPRSAGNRGNTARHNQVAYDHHIREAALGQMLDPLLIKAIIKAESDFNPYAVSARGAQGLMQLMPETARDMNVRDPFDAAQNITGGTRYFRSLLNQYEGDLSLSLAAYNAGPGRVAKKGPLPRIVETRDYVRKVIRYYRSYQESQVTPVSLSGNITMGEMVTIN
jgi:soluble lytic murein transglycosylase